MLQPHRTFPLLMVSILTLGPGALWSHPHLRPMNDPEFGADQEARLHTPPGFDKPGKPSTATESAARLSVTIRDRATGKNTFCRVNVVGSDGNYYEPKENPLAPWSLHRKGNRRGKAPARYYGWFFYSSGAFEVEVPPGTTRIEVWKGFEYRPTTRTVKVIAGESLAVSLQVERTAEMHKLGYWSGDTHIHLDRISEKDDARALDLTAAEDIRYGFLLCMNEPSTYSGLMSRQEWQQQRGFGPESAVRRGSYAIASGQEYRCHSFGHICLLMHRQLVHRGLTVNPNNWPMFGHVADATHRLGGYAFHAHGGYSQEILADFAQRKTDGVELLQFARFRGIGREGWYKILNAGFQFPAVGASDFPYCRALGDSRTYVYCANQPSFTEWVQAAAAGASFFTSGPMLLLEVNGLQPGSRIDVDDQSPQSVTARVRVYSEVAPVTHVDLIVGGEQYATETFAADRSRSRWLELKREIPIDRSTWIAARAYSSSPLGHPDAEAHTNPLYVYLEGRAPYDERSLDGLVSDLDAYVQSQDKRQFAEKAQVLEYLNTSRDRLLRIREQRGLAAPSDGKH